MCGFVGYINGMEGKLSDDTEVLNNMMTRIIHRGPDSEGKFTNNDVSFGFRRLSIIDLRDCGNQPFYSEDGRYVMVFNGEIYNYQEIRKILIEKGYHFISDTDSEVIIRGYEEYGEAIIPKLRGMFAIAIWDVEEKRALLARDGFGIKPLYYTQNTTDNSFIFGSEIKSFMDHPRFIKALNKEAIRPYLTFQYNPLRETFFEGVYKLEPAHYMTYQDGHIEMHRYWDVAFDDETAEKPKKPMTYYIEKIKKVLDDSVEKHSISDVNVASFLSSGVDSSLITRLLHPQKSFSVGFDQYKEEMFNETKASQALSKQLGIENHSKYITGEEVFEVLPKIAYHLDEPDANYSILPLYFLNQLAVNNDVKVVLSGEGADEIFGGYAWYKPSKFEEKYLDRLPLALRKALNHMLPETKTPSRLKQLLSRSVLPVEDKFIGEAKIFNDDEANEILKPDYRSNLDEKAVTMPIYNRVKNQSDLQKMQYLDLNLWLPGDILLKADKMSMAHSIELRVPFLDKEVMELAKHIPDEYRVTYDETKVVLRETAKEVLPEEWANRTKLGFPTPVRHWLKEEPLHSAVKEMFQSELCAKFFDQETLNGLLEDHCNNVKDYGHRIYAAYLFLLWYKIYFVEDKGKCQARV